MAGEWPFGAELSCGRSVAAGVSWCEDMPERLPLGRAGRGRWCNAMRCDARDGELRGKGSGVGGRCCI